MSQNPSDDPVENRSEIFFLWDAVNCNPNGNPLSSGNEPRIDPITGHAIVTDVRIKRYIRDQLDDDGHGVFIRNTRNEEGDRPTRGELLKDRLQGATAEEIDETVFDTFLNNSTDVRMFGATLSIKTDDDELLQAFNEKMPESHFKGPIQFAPARSLNAPVQRNDEFSSLTSVIGTQEGKSQGGFDLGDHRLKYAMFLMRGIVDENGADTTKLKEEDVSRLDTLCWRALKNQSLSRSKMGQEPRLYVRVEYEKDSFHIGDLGDSLTLDEEHSAEPEAMRGIRDAVVNVTDFANRLEKYADHIDMVHVAASDSFLVNVDGELGGSNALFSALTEAVGEDRIHEIDVVSEYKATLGKQSQESPADD